MIDEFCGELLKTHGEKCRGLLFQQAIGEGADATVRQGFRKCLDRLRAVRPSGIAISSEDKHAFLVGDALAAVYGLRADLPADRRAKAFAHCIEVNGLEGLLADVVEHTPLGKRLRDGSARFA